MRKIEYLMLDAIRKRTHWKLDNTEVHLRHDSALLEVYLFNNLIAFEASPPVEGKPLSRFVINGDVLIRYATSTTLSRLRAMGFALYTRKGVVYHDGAPVAHFRSGRW